MSENNIINRDLNNTGDTPSANRIPTSSVNSKLDNASDDTTASVTKKGGIMAWLFGTESSIAARHITFTLCCILVVITSLFKPDAELVRCIVPVFTLSLGYIFGKDDSSADK